MTLLIAGLLLWGLAHFFKRIAPDVRTNLGNAGRGLVALVIAVGVVLMILGYRGADYIHVWSPPAFMIHINNALMMLSVWIFATAELRKASQWPATRIRHPQLTAMKTWAVAHLLVNGDLASIILFGGLLGWAVASVVLINRAEPNWKPRPPGGRTQLLRLAVIVPVAFALIAGLHLLLGVNPFPA